MKTWGKEGIYKEAIGRNLKMVGDWDGEGLG
jgi:hypothetical protein